MKSSNQLVIQTKRQKPRPGQGPQAAKTMYQRATDQVAKSIRNRYGGKSGITNIAKDVSMLMGVINTEDKSVEILPALQTVTGTTSVVYALGTMAQGTSNSTRVGNSILVNRMDLNLHFRYSSGTAATTSQQNQLYRWFLVRYLKTPSTNGTIAFGITEFLDVDCDGNTTPQSFPNTDTAQNFQIMEQGMVDLTLPNVPAASANVDKLVTISHQCHFHQEYSGAANTTITSNMTFMVVVAMFQNNTGGVSQVSMANRTWYIDN